MHKHFLLFRACAAFFLSLPLGFALSQPPTPALAYACEQTPAPASHQTTPTRRNLGLFFDKLRAQKTVSVAYFGGSNAAGLEAKTPYRAHIAQWLKQQFPSAKLSELNAAVPGTGALYGALRARRDVIAYKPDLVFLDFALPESQDAPEAEEAFKKALEGLLRQFLIVPQPPEIVLLYAANAKRPDTPNTGRVAWCEALATHYQIPALDLQTAAWKLIDEGQLKPSVFGPGVFGPGVFGKDGAAANDELHKAYGQQITAFLAAQAALTPTPLVRNLVNPLVSDEMNYGEFKAIAEIKHSPLWKTETSHDRALPAALLVTDKPGAELDLFFDGTVVGLTFQVGPQGGAFECLIDGKPAPAPLTKVDGYDAATRLQTRIIPGGLPQGEHKLTIRVTAERAQKSHGNQVKLGSLLVGGQRPEKL